MKWAENCSGIEDEEEDEGDLGDEEGERGEKGARKTGSAEWSTSMDLRPRWRSVLPRIDRGLLFLALPR